MALSNLDVHYLILEAKALEGEFLQKAFGQSGTFRFKFRHTDWVFHLPEAAFLTQTPPQFTAHPDSFVMLLRKRLTGRLEKISQMGFDRIVQLHFSDVSIIVELFGEGNLLLLDQIGYILKPWRGEQFASRKLYAGQKYVAPPQDKTHPSAWTPALLEGLAGPIIAGLSKTVNLSPFYLEEVCIRAGVDKKKPANRLPAEDKANLQTALRGLLDEPLAPRIYLEDGKPMHAAPFELKSLEAKQQQATATFSEALQTVHAHATALKAAEDANAAPVMADERKTAVLEKQHAGLESFQQRASDAQKKAEWIYLHFDIIEKLRNHSDSEEETIRNQSILPPQLKWRKKRHRIEIELPDSPTPP
ncbi:NFACT family protein [Candidatus Micrarchaeota archaeon]|nr:NFACT family protein [Candidatus Micrarchaeota archaeon]